MSYAFKLKNGATAVFDPESAKLSITTPHGDVQHSTLARAEARLLDLLLIEPGVTKTREEIIDYTWNDRVVASGSLNQAVFSLRNILNDSRDHEIVMTLPRRGYCFNRHYLIDEQTEAPLPSNQIEQPVVPAAEPMLPAGDADLSSALEKSKKTGMATKCLLAGYAITLLLCVFTFSRFSFSFDTPTIETSSTQQNEITLHALGNNVAEAQTLRDISAEQAKKLPSHLKGQVWINHTKTNYSVSCIRPDLSTANLESNSHQNDLAMMIQRCLEATL